MAKGELKELFDRVLFLLPDEKREVILEQFQQYGAFLPRSVLETDESFVVRNPVHILLTLPERGVEYSMNLRQAKPEEREKFAQKLADSGLVPASFSPAKSGRSSNEISDANLRMWYHQSLWKIMARFSSGTTQATASSSSGAAAATPATPAAASVSASQ